MKYIKLYENFQERKPISDEDWEKFEEVHSKFDNEFWVREFLYDNEDGTFDYDGALEFEKLEINSLKEVIPLSLRNVDRSFSCISCTNLINLEGAPQSVGRYFWCIGCDGLTSLKGAPQSVGEDFSCSGCEGLTSLKGAPQSVGEDFWCINCAGLISDLNVPDKSIIWEGYSRKGIQEHLNSAYFSAPAWFESLAFVGARDPEAYIRVCQDFPNETTFTDEQVDDYLNSPLIDRKSTEEDWKIVKDILDRTKKYDHSEYRDSQLDSEWKEVF